MVEIKIKTKKQISKKDMEELETILTTIARDYIKDKPEVK